MDRLLTEAGVHRPVRVDLSHGTLYAAAWESADKRSWKIFLVNRSGGRLFDPVLSLDPTVFGDKAEVLIDMERQREAVVSPDGQLKLPSFAHSSLVTIPSRE